MENIKENKPQPQLSILIPSIPSRFDSVKSLYNRILGLVEDKNIEVLMLMDNKVMTIGDKRNYLKNICIGKYFMIVDDDDDLISLDEIYQATFLNPDVITFKQKCQNSDKSTFIVTFGLGNEVEHKTNEKGMYLDIKRPPFHVCAWHERFKIISFPATNYAEDWGFVEAANKIAKTEIHIDRIIHAYNFDPAVTEASTSEQVENGYRKAFNDAVSAKIEKGEIKLGHEPEDVRYVNEKELSYATLSTETKNEYAIVNLITDGIPRYKMGQDRLIESMNEWCPKNVDCYYFVGEDSVGAPGHADNPYAFKLYAINKLRGMGYKKILWLDASVVAVADFMSIFKWIEDKGIFFEDSGWAAGEWTNDAALQLLGVTREQAWKMPMYSAGFSGFDFTNKISDEFFARWWLAMEKGAFKGSHKDHRHDMSCGSIIANLLALTNKYAFCTQFFSYIGEGYKPNPSSPFHLLGL